MIVFWPSRPYFNPSSRLSIIRYQLAFSLAYTLMASYFQKIDFAERFLRPVASWKRSQFYNLEVNRWWFEYPFTSWPMAYQNCKIVNVTLAALCSILKPRGSVEMTKDWKGRWFWKWKAKFEQELQYFQLIRDPNN